MLVVTTRGRKRIVTMENMPDQLRDSIAICVWDDDERPPGYEKNDYVTFSAKTPAQKHLAEKRARLIRHCPDDKIILLDDDLRWYTRVYDGPGNGARKLVNADPPDIRDALIAVWNHLDNYAHAYISARNGNNTQYGDYGYNERPLRVLGYRVDVLRNLPAFREFPAMPLMSDFHLALMLLDVGYQSVVDYRWCQEQANYTQNPGGCELYRTPEMFEECSQTLVNLYPHCVSLKKKRLVTGGNVAERTDVRVQWKKCFLTGIGQ